MSFHHIKIGDQAPEILNTIIEIPKGSNNKYEFDEKLDIIRLDRTIYSPMFYPADYGFIPETRGGDGDHLDVLVITNSPVFSGCLVEIRPIGVLKMSDDKGQDDKLIAVPVSNPLYKDTHDISDLHEHTLNEISHFFTAYKTLEKKVVTVQGWGNKQEAIKLIEEGRKLYASEK